MTVESKQNYQLKGNPVIVNVPVIGNLVYDDLGQEVLAQFNERFKGTSIADTNRYKQGEVISYSNIPRALGYNQILREISNLRVLSPLEVVRFWDSIPERSSTYADTDSVAVYPNEGANEDLRKRALDINGINAKKLKTPLIIAGLGVEKADNKYGFDFVETDYMKAEEAPFLSKDGNVRYEDGKLIESEDGIRLWTLDSQSGLRRLFRDRSDGLYADRDDLVGSSGSGRVQVIQEPKARVENLEALAQKLKEEKEQDVARIESNYQKALKVLKTGKL